MGMPLNEQQRTLDSAYKSIYEFVKSKDNPLDRQIEQGRIGEQHISNLRGLIAALPTPQLASELEKVAILCEVMCGYLEWTHHLGEPGSKIGDLAKRTLTMVGQHYILSEQQKTRLAISQLHPVLFQTRKVV